MKDVVKSVQCILEYCWKDDEFWRKGVLAWYCAKHLSHGNFAKSMNVPSFILLQFLLILYYIFLVSCYVCIFYCKLLP